MYFVFLTFIVGCSTQKKEKIWGTFDAGHYAVGFCHFLQHDTSRFIADSTYRPVQIGFWYPTQIDKGARIKFPTYFLLSDLETDSIHTAPDDSLIAQYKRLAISSGISQKGIDSVFAMASIAHENAPVLTKSLPVVLVAQGNGHALFDQLVLCEYLASHGYYVISTPSPTRITGGFQTYKGLVDKAYEQADDLELARQYIVNKYSLSNDKIGIVAYSFGARSALLEAMKYKNIDALVSWDGGIGNAIGKEWIDEVPNFDPSLFKAPLLHIYQPGDEVVKPNFRLIDSLASKFIYKVKIDRVNHGFFMIRGAADAVISNFQDHPYPKAKIKYSSLLQITEQFLDHYLKQNTNTKFEAIADMGNESN